MLCISNLKLNNETIKIGRYNDLKKFRFSQKNQECRNDFMSTSKIQIRGKEVISSRCKGFLKQI